MRSTYSLSRTSVAVALALSAFSSGLWATTVDLGSSNVEITDTKNYANQQVTAEGNVTVKSTGSLTTGSFTGKGNLAIEQNGSMTSSGAVSASRFENSGTFNGTDVTASTSQYMYNNGKAVLSGSMVNEATDGYIQNKGDLSIAGDIKTANQLTQAGGTLTFNAKGQQSIDTKNVWATAGKIVVDAGANVIGNAAWTTKGSLKVEGKGSLTVGTLTNLETAEVSVSALHVTDRLDNQAKLTSDQVIIDKSFINQNQGVVDVNKLVLNDGASVSNYTNMTVGTLEAENGLLTNYKNGQFSGTHLTVGKLDNQGKMELTGENATLTVNSELKNSGTLTIGKSLIATSASLMNSGIITGKDGAGLEEINVDVFNNDSNGVITTNKLTALSKLSNAGNLTVNGNVFGPDAGSINNTGTMSVSGNIYAGSKLEKGNGVTNTGTLTLTGTDQVIRTNTVWNGSSGKIFATHGSVKLEADVQNSGLIAKSETDALTKFEGQGFINMATGTFNANEVVLSGALTNLGNVKAQSLKSKSLENRSDNQKVATITVIDITTTGGSVSNSGQMSVGGDIQSASNVNNTGSMMVDGSVSAVGQIAVTGDSGVLTMKANDAQLTAASIYNTGKIFAGNALTANATSFINKGMVAASETEALKTLNTQTLINDVLGVVRVVDMTSEGDVTNNGKIESSGALKVQRLTNTKGATLTAESLSTTKDNHKGHMNNLGVMTITGEVNVQGHFGNLNTGEFKAGTLTTSNAVDSGKSFEVTNLNLEVSPETSKGLGFMDFMSETSVAKIGTLKTPNGQLKVFGAGIEINTVADASNVIVQVDDFTPGKAKIGTNNGSMSVEISSEMAEQLDPNNLTSGMQKAADTVLIERGHKDKTVFAPSSTILGELEAYTDANGKIVTVKEEANVFNVGVSEMASTAMLAWRAENNDMFKRLGDVRRGDAKNGIWARVMAGESEYGTQNLENDFTTLQFGYDHRVGAANEWILGGAFTYTKGETTFDYGTGDNYQFGLALYGSYLGLNGGYVDVIGKYSRLKNEFDALGGVGKGEYYGNGVSVSVEAGHRFDTSSGLYLEPQVEFTYGYLTDVNYSTSVGASVAQDSMKSAVGRVGFNVGKSFEKGNVHAGVSWLKDWEGETSVQMSYSGHTRNFAQDLGDDWVEFEVGGAYDVRDNLKLYGSFETTTGGDVKMPWLANVGIRYVY